MSPTSFAAQGPMLIPAVVGGADPPTIFGSNLIGWWKADTSVLKSGGGAAGNGDVVDVWTDQSASAANLGQAVAGPIYQSAGINGLPAVVFTNNAVPTNSHLMQGSANAIALGGQALSVFIVCQMDSATENNGRLFCFLASTDNNDVAASTSVGILRDATNNAFTTYRGTGVTQMATMAIPTGTTKHLGMVYDGAGVNTGGTPTVTPYVNGVAGTSPPPYTGTDANDTFGALGALAIGSQFSGSWAGGPSATHGWTGPIAEVVVAKVAATTAQAVSLSAYFTGRGF